MKLLTRVLKEPLLHFVLLATALFLLSSYWESNARIDDDTTIVVSQAQIRSMANLWQRTWQRPPTPAELDNIIEEYVREEVLCREAKAIGIDQNDTIIRRRLRQKMEFLALADAVASDDQLQTFLDAHPQRFLVDQRTTFRHVYLNPEKHGDDLDRYSLALLTELRTAEQPADTTELGDRFLQGYAFEKLSERSADSIFGPGFAAQLRTMEAGSWQGPIRSGYGVHLVFVDERSEGRVPDLADVREAVELEWSVAQRDETKEEFYRGLRKQYEVIIELPEPEESDAQAEGTP